jgi:hypothetical protein
MIHAISLYIHTYINQFAPWFSGLLLGCSRILHGSAGVGTAHVTYLPASRALSSLRWAQVHAFRVKEWNV